MPDGDCARHLLKALLVEEGDAWIGPTLMSFRFADAARRGQRLDMYEHEAVGRPAVAMHLAVWSEILPHP